MRNGLRRHCCRCVVEWKCEGIRQSICCQTADSLVWWGVVRYTNILAHFLFVGFNDSWCWSPTIGHGNTSTNHVGSRRGLWYPWRHQGLVWPKCEWVHITSRHWLHARMHQSQRYLSLEWHIKESFIVEYFTSKATADLNWHTFVRNGPYSLDISLTRTWGTLVPLRLTGRVRQCNSQIELLLKYRHDASLGEQKK